jgi:hypothetical protein
MELLLFFKSGVSVLGQAFHSTNEEETRDVLVSSSSSSSSSSASL